jgi:hypothetical protein
LEVNHGAPFRACPERLAARRGLALGTPAAAGGNAGGGLANARTVFVTSQVYDTNLDGLQGADLKCQTLATAAGLKGRYKAWLSDSTASPSTRFVKSKGPYKLMETIFVYVGVLSFHPSRPLSRTHQAAANA